MARSSASGRGRGGGRGSGRDSNSTDSIAPQQSNVRRHASVASLNNSGDDNGDESVSHVSFSRRGPAAQVQVPDPINREWIWVVHDQFSNQTKATAVILSNLKCMWNGPWEGWKDVPVEDRERLFERFQGHFQWEPSWHALIYRCWEQGNAKKFGDLLSRARTKAMTIAAEKGFEVGDDFSIFVDFKPTWMRSEYWNQLVDIWNTQSWKDKSKRNASNRNKSTSKHTLGSQTLVTAKLRAEKELGRDVSWEEMWRQSHCKKGKRPLDKLSEVGSSVVEDLDLEEDVQQHKDEWVDERSYNTMEIYKEYLVEKYGEDDSQHPPFDEPLWLRASRATGGKNKGKLYGLSNISDPLGFVTGTPSTSCNSSSYGHGRQDPEIQRLNKIIEELVKEKEMEKAEKEKEKSEKEKEKAEKEAMLERMTSIESMLKLVTKNLPSSS